MLPLLTADEMRATEAAYEGSLDDLMEKAGAAVAEVVLERFPGKVTVVCGGGNNGGDGRICARILTERGRDVVLIDRFGELGEPDVVVDALLGIGLKEAPRDEVARMIEAINRAGKPVISIDVPSGVVASTGEIPGVAVRANLTVTFGAPKVGLAISPGRFHAGTVEVAPIGLEPASSEHALVPASILDGVPRKTWHSTKYRAGAVLVVGGSAGMSGAPMLASLAALRADAGYVMAAVPESVLPVLEARLLEAVKVGLPEDSAGRVVVRAAETVLEAAERVDAVVLGPGLGRSDGTREFVRVLLERLDVPVVVDADALWRLEPFTRTVPTILTPHTGELAGLLGVTPADVDSDRLGAARRAAALLGSVVLLKGADTLVAAPRHGVLVAPYGFPSLATAGSGDVLAGVIGAFLAKGLEPRIAAAAGAVAHGLASRIVEPQPGLIASDLLVAIQRALSGELRGLPPLAELA